MPTFFDAWKWNGKKELPKLESEFKNRPKKIRYDVYEVNSLWGIKPNTRLYFLFPQKPSCAMFIQSSMITFMITVSEDGEILYKFKCARVLLVSQVIHESWFSKIALDVTMVKFYIFCDDSVSSR